MHANETYVDQVGVADVVVGHKADAASEVQQAAFWEWAEQLYPPKLEVSELVFAGCRRALPDFRAAAARGMATKVRTCADMGHALRRVSAP